MRLPIPPLACAIAALLIAAAAPDAGAATLDVWSSVSFAPLQARSGTPVVHKASAGSADACSPDPACSTFTFAWDFGSGTFTPVPPNLPGLTHAYGTAGIHQLALRISQDADAVTRTVRFATHAGNWAPAPEALADFPDDQVTGRAFTVQTIGRDDSPSSGWMWGVDTDGDGDFNDATLTPGGEAPAGTGVVGQVTYAQDGVHTLRVRLADGQGGSSTVPVAVRTHTANEPPRTGLTINGEVAPSTVAPGDLTSGTRAATTITRTSRRSGTGGRSMGSSCPRRARS